MSLTATQEVDEATWPEATEITPTIDLPALIEARRQHEAMAALVEQSRRQWTERNANLLEAERIAREALAQVERAYRGQAEEAFLATGDKNPIPGASIRLTKKLDLDVKRATVWAMAARHDLLTFDAKTFEREARTWGVLPEWCTFVTVPTVCLASDLEAALLPKPAKLTEADLLPSELAVTR